MAQYPVRITSERKAYLFMQIIYLFNTNLRLYDSPVMDEKENGCQNRVKIGIRLFPA